MNLFYLFRLLATNDSLPETIQELVEVAGIMAIAFIILLGFIFFLPTIISGLRKAKLRWLIFIVNMIFIVVAFFNIILPLIIWLVLMIFASAGKKDKDKIETSGIKITYSYKEDD